MCFEVRKKTAQQQAEEKQELKSKIKLKKFASVSQRVLLINIKIVFALFDQIYYKNKLHLQ